MEVKLPLIFFSFMVNSLPPSFSNYSYLIISPGMHVSLETPQEMLLSAVTAPMQLSQWDTSHEGGHSAGLQERDALVQKEPYSST